MHCLCVFERPFGVVVTSLLVREIKSSILGPVKLDTVPPLARQRCYVSLEIVVVFSGRSAVDGPIQFLTLERNTANRIW